MQNFQTLRRTKSELRQNYAPPLNLTKVTIVDVTVDGIPLKDLKSYRVSSPLFNLTLPEIMSSDYHHHKPSKRYLMATTGCFLEPLPVGEHTIYSNGVLLGFNDNFVSTVIYHITVEP
jgi:hypothetical protein